MEGKLSAGSRVSLLTIALFVKKSVESGPKFRGGILSNGCLTVLGVQILLDEYENPLVLD